MVTTDWAEPSIEALTQRIGGLLVLRNTGGTDALADAVADMSREDRGALLVTALLLIHDLLPAAPDA